MGRKAKGKPLTFFPVRVDEDVRAAILKLKDKHDTINEGLRLILVDMPATLRDMNHQSKITLPKLATREQMAPVFGVPPRVDSFKRGIRPKGDAKR